MCCGSAVEVAFFVAGKDQVNIAISIEIQSRAAISHNVGHVVIMACGELMLYINAEFVSDLS